MPATSMAPTAHADKRRQGIILGPVPDGSRSIVDCTMTSFLGKYAAYQTGVSAVCAQSNNTGGEACNPAGEPVGTRVSGLFATISHQTQMGSPPASMRAVHRHDLRSRCALARECVNYPCRAARERTIARAQARAGRG